MIGLVTLFAILILAAMFIGGGVMIYKADRLMVAPYASGGITGRPADEVPASVGRFAGLYQSAAAASPSGKYLPALAASLAAVNARFHSWEFEPATRTLDPETASAEALRAALSDCRCCAAVEYPETDEGTGYALKRLQVLDEALRRRFPDQAEAIFAAVYDQAEFASRLAHRRS